MFATVTVNDWVSIVMPSLTSRVTAWSPTSALVGVPVSEAVPSPLSVRVSQLGRVEAVMARVSPASTSVAVIA